MPAYSYKERFVPMVLDGSKEQTVRGRRKHPPRIGQIAYNFFGMRTKHCKKLNQKEIRKVNGICVTDNYTLVLYERVLELDELEMAKWNPLHPCLPDRKLLSQHDANIFAWNDGFRPDGTTLENCDGCFDLMIRFWKITHSLPWAGDVIYYPTDKPVQTIESLQKAVKQRDEIIVDLQTEIEALTDLVDPADGAFCD